MTCLTSSDADKRLWALCITSCFFEGSMYLWIFFKFPALELSRELSGGKGTDLPFGVIFAALMCSMMLGSLFFTYYSSLPASRWVATSSTLLTVTLMVASLCFVVPVICQQEAATFWCFSIFEICCGIYFPSIAHLKEKYVDDGVRAKIYTIMRFPLNAFVFIGLVVTKEGICLSVMYFPQELNGFRNPAQRKRIYCLQWGVGSSFCRCCDSSGIVVV
jgi:MFS transporter, MFS domain-containing protein family, molybdate-anion transporter